MASYWKSQPRKFCEICKCWIGDNKASIDFHERGKSHQEKKKRQLDQIKKRSKEQCANNAKAETYLKQMEAAAKKKYLKDLKEQGVNVDEYLRKQEELEKAANPPTSSSKTVKPKFTEKPTKPKTASFKVEKSQTPQTLQEVYSTSNGHPLGKWTVVESTKNTTQTLIAAKPKAIPVEFAEKRVNETQLDEGETVSFKKRKTNPSKKSRSIRSRIDE
ncbi:uncharacterized protein LOC143469480 [Clavelina lepadiformis]|uniref:Matrin-type domain-containing protein n=1 Tax=Clavelina lepadiformis TaxID=159417 RepID=A0ABP0F8I4_CLALP